jgi:branched-chain amino acid transport system ATP-binding protein
VAHDLAIKVDSLDVHYKDFQALWKVSLRVKKGEIVSVIGANGSGKSTLLNTISGILKPSSGRIIFQEEDITYAPGHQIVQKGIAQVPEGRKLFPLMNVKDNLLIGASFPQAKRDRLETLKKVFNLFPVLENRLHQIAETLSGGEQQMVAIGRALMAKPRLLILDEPSLGLSPIMVREVFEVIDQLHTKDHITILLVEQNLKLALSSSHYTYVLENGRTVLEGTSDEIMKNEYTKKAYLGI